MMYHERARAILRSNLPTTQRFVLVALSDHVNEHGECFPKVVTLALETGLSERAVQVALRELEGLGHVHTKRVGGQPATYQIDLSNLQAASPRVRRDRGAPRSPQGVHHVHPRGEAGSGAKQVHPGGEAGSPGGANDVRPERASRTIQETGQSDTPTGENQPQPPPERSPAQRVFAAWLGAYQARKASQGRSSSKSKWTAEEESYIRSALKQSSEAELLAMVGWAFAGTDDYARQLQGLKPFRDGGTPTEYLGISTLFKDSGLAKRIALGEAFRPSAAVAPPAPSTPDPLEEMAKRAAEEWATFGHMPLGANSCPAERRGDPKAWADAVAVMGDKGPSKRRDQRHADVWRFVDLYRESLARRPPEAA